MNETLQSMFYGAAVAFMAFAMFIFMSVDVTLDKINDSIKVINICVKEV